MEITVTIKDLNLFFYILSFICFYIYYLTSKDYNRKYLVIYIYVWVTGIWNIVAYCFLDCGPTAFIIAAIHLLLGFILGFVYMILNGDLNDD